MGLRDLFRRRPDPFIQRLEQQASLTLRGIEALKAYNVLQEIAQAYGATIAKWHWLGRSIIL